MPDKRCLVIQQVPYEGPGRMGEALESLGWDTRTVAAYDGDPVPTSPPDDCAALVVLGGPMFVGDEEEFPFLADEKRLLRAAIDQDFPTLGICLGAQLLATVAGARVYRGLKPEIGWLPVALTEKAEDDALFGQTLPRAFHAFQFHHDTFDLPRKAVHLAKSTFYTRQAFRMGQNVYAIQFHLEADEQMIQALRPRMPADVEGDDHVRRLQEAKPWADRFFRLFLERTGAR